MSLPKINVPTFEVEIPSTKKKIIMRPFLVKEEKILLLALASGVTDDITLAIKQIVNNCVLTKGFNIDKIEIFDLEYLLLQLRINSVGAITKIRFYPRENVECKECSQYREIDIDLRTAYVDFQKNHSKKIDIDETVGLVMKYPSVKILSTLEQAKASNNIEDLFKVIWLCVEGVYDGSQLQSTTDVDIAEGIQFLESLNSEQFSKIEQFFATMPKLKLTTHIKCKTCNFEQDYTIEGLENFFV